MKNSIYNSYIFISDNVLLIYNSLTGKYVFIPVEINKFGLTQQEIIYKILECDSYEEVFRNNGILVEKKFDEVDMLQKHIDSVRNNPNTCILHINPTLDCNLRCSYCYEKHTVGKIMTKEVLSGVMNLIDEILKKNPSVQRFHLGFFGGEPLIGYDDCMKPLIEHFLAACTQHKVEPIIGVTSNAVLLKEEMLKSFEKTVTMFQITLDGPRYEHNKVRFKKAGEGTYDDILTNIEFLSNNKIKVLIRINFTADKVSTLCSIIDELNKLSFDKNMIEIDFQRVWQDRKSDFFNSDIKEDIKKVKNEFKKNGFKVIEHDILNNLEECCYGNMKNYMLINFNGDIYHCTARDFDGKYCIGKLNKDGRISWNYESKNLYETAILSKQVCRSCRIAPICMGGCVQKAVENHYNDSCIYGFTEEDKDQVVMDRVIHFFINQEISN